jgi:hypothetical protein
MSAIVASDLPKHCYQWKNKPYGRKKKTATRKGGEKEMKTAIVDLEDDEKASERPLTTQRR